MSKLINRMAEEIQTRHDNKVYNNIPVLESAQGAWITLKGKQYLNMCSNNYLGFANDPEVNAAAIAAINHYGVGAGAVRSISGSQQCHIDFEQALARFKGVEDVILVQSGFQANTTVVPTITGPGDVIISDELNHASIIDGVRLSKAKKMVYKHKDMTDLLEKVTLAQEEAKDGIVLIITDGVFSMDGDLAPLDEIVKIKEQFDNVVIMVDDAHGEGVLGSHGKGIIDHYHLHGKVDIEVGTLSKAFGIAGGFVGGNKVLIDYLKQKARPFLFSTGVDSAMCGAGMKVVEKMMASDENVVRLWDNARYFQLSLKELGFNTWVTETPISPVIVYDEAKATIMKEKLAERNILVSPIMYPTVAKGLARIRLMVSATHTKEDLDYAIKNIFEVGKELEII